MTARFAVRLTPRAGANSVDGVGEDGALRVRVAAIPVGGAANEALCRLLAREIGVSRGVVRIVAGATGRRKLAEADVDPAALAAAWPGIAVGTPRAGTPRAGTPAAGASGIAPRAAGRAGAVRQ